MSIGSASAQHGQKHSHSIGLNALNVLDLASRAFEQVAQLAGLLRVQRALAHLGEQRAAESLNRLADRLLADRRGGGKAACGPNASSLVWSPGGAGGTASGSNESNTGAIRFIL